MGDFVAKTQAELGAVIDTPKLTEKLLGRPPFRFLHDIITSFIKTAAFPVGLYAENQLDSNNVAEKDSKIEFLQRLITVVEAATGTSCDVKPQRIVAGQEPEKTNELLQLLARCAALSPDAKAAAVAKVNGTAPAKASSPKERRSSKPAAEEKTEKKPREKTEEKTEEKPREKTEEKPRETEEERRRRHEERRREKEKEKTKASEEPEDKEKAAKEAKEAERRRRHEERKRASETEDQHQASSHGGAAAEDATTTSARKAPPRTKPTHEVIAAQNAADATPVPGVIREAKRGEGDNADDADDMQDWQKVAEQYDAKPVARTAAVAEDAEVKGRLGQQALQAKRQQEEAARRAEEDGTAAASAPADGGIIIRSSKSGASRGGASHTLGDSDLNQLREQLQLLTKASNPLGKFLEAIHDDIDSMTRELEMWCSESRNQALAAAEARRQTEESLQEIHANLQSLEDAISDQMQKTNNLRQHILMNDTATEAMMKMIVNPDISSQ